MARSSVTVQRKNTLCVISSAWHIMGFSFARWLGGRVCRWSCVVPWRSGGARPGAGGCLVPRQWVSCVLFGQFTPRCRSGIRFRSVVDPVADPVAAGGGAAVDSVLVPLLLSVRATLQVYDSSSNSSLVNYPYVCSTGSWATSGVCT